MKRSSKAWVKYYEYSMSSCFGVAVKQNKTAENKRHEARALLKRGSCSPRGDAPPFFSFSFSFSFSFLSSLRLLLPGPLFVCAVFSLRLSSHRCVCGSGGCNTLLSDCNTWHLNTRVYVHIHVYIFQRLCDRWYMYQMVSTCVLVGLELIVYEALSY